MTEENVNVYEVYDKGYDDGYDSGYDEGLIDGAEGARADIAEELETLAKQKDATEVALLLVTLVDKFRNG